jgi:hypothetical protein
MLKKQELEAEKAKQKKLDVEKATELAQQVLEQKKRELEAEKESNSFGLEVGDQVLARSQIGLGGLGKYWYVGTISKINSNGVLHINFADGDTEWVEDGNYVLKSHDSSLYSGDKVLARYYDSGYDKKYWYLGTIDRVTGQGWYVTYNDGDSKFHSDRTTLVEVVVK